jgi:hypothetical protein
MKTTSGNLFAQGLVGGAFGGYVYVLLIILCQVDAPLWMVLSATPFCMVLGSIIGVIEAMVIRTLYRLTGFQMPAAMRVSVASVVATLSVGFVSFQPKVSENDLTVWLIMMLSFAVPPALMIDSNIRLSKLFTSALGGALPLRFLSLGVTGLWLLFLAQQARTPLFIVLRMLGWLPLLYLGISAFLTFTSPGRLVLLVLGIGGNVPVVLCSWVFFSEYYFFYGPDWLLVLSIICWAFLISWTIFVIARVSVDARELEALSMRPDKQGFISDIVQAKLSETVRFR